MAKLHFVLDFGDEDLCLHQASAAEVFEVLRRIYQGEGVPSVGGVRVLHNRCSPSVVAWKMDLGTD